MIVWVEVGFLDRDSCGKAPNPALRTLCENVDRCWKRAMEWAWDFERVVSIVFDPQEPFWAFQQPINENLSIKLPFGRKRSEGGRKILEFWKNFMTYHWEVSTVFGLNIFELDHNRVEVGRWATRFWKWAHLSLNGNTFRRDNFEKMTMDGGVFVRGLHNNRRGAMFWNSWPGNCAKIANPYCGAKRG